MTDRYMKHLTIILFAFSLLSIQGAPPARAPSGRQPRPAAADPRHPPADSSAPRPADARYTIRILCLYGSVPAKGYWKVEPYHGPHNLINMVAKLHGGHVGIEYAPDKVLSFQPQAYGGLAASGHFVAHFSKRSFNSWFRVYSVDRMWSCLGNRYNSIDSLRRAVFVIPITAAQRHTLDSLVKSYTTQTPYDYAFFGMRCASSSYDVLQTAGILPKTGLTWYNVFTTQEFRYLLYQEYLRNRGEGWQLYTSKGSVSRKWEKDIDNWTGY
ncbi:MAG TPA: hypothetical protein VFE32_04755 [Puia sp.]|jgi:hypothetical protein|nr:hypothetical protein [Puia sp.]